MNDDNNLFWELIEPEHRKARAFCRKLMGNRDDGDDLYQDSLVCALTGFDGLREKKAVRSWLYRIIINQFKNRKRSAWWKKILPVSAVKLEHSSGSYNPDPAYAARRQLQHALAVLSPDDRVLVTLSELQGWSFRHIAALTGKTEVNLRVRASRARSKMHTEIIRRFGSSSEKKEMQTFRSEEKICVAGKSGKN